MYMNIEYPIDYYKSIDDVNRWGCPYIGLVHATFKINI